MANDTDRDADAVDPTWAETIPPRKRGRLRAGFWLVLGLLGGIVIGARYVAPTQTAQVFLGSFLPPHGTNYERFDLELGMSKGEVVNKLGIERVVVIAGAALGRWKARGGPHQQPLTEQERRQLVEVWYVPKRTEGLSDFLVLGFDMSQRLRMIATDHSMLGFSTDTPYASSRLGPEANP